MKKKLLLVCACCFMLVCNFTFAVMAGPVNPIIDPLRVL